MGVNTMNSEPSIEEIRKLYKEYPALCDQLPFVFKHGNSIDTIVASCSSCGADVSATLKGVLTPAIDNTVLTCRGLGVCAECMQYVNVHCRFRSIDGYTFHKEFIDDDGVWKKTITQNKQGFISKLKKFFTK
jgi:hypothetical protein